MRLGEDGGIVVECPLIPGCISQGETHDEALVNIREAIEPASKIAKAKAGPCGPSTSL